MTSRKEKENFSFSFSHSEEMKNLLHFKGRGRCGLLTATNQPKRLKVSKEKFSWKAFERNSLSCTPLLKHARNADWHHSLAMSRRTRRISRLSAKRQLRNIITNPNRAFAIFLSRKLSQSKVQRTLKTKLIRKNE